MRQTVHAQLGLFVENNRHSIKFK